ncbi:HlyD family efflux transporter periplasmic adaptor subunit [Serratia marcescens]|nr:HlyD family efflux transporter periplasmic adaptor subunit [Serratia marcescens]
MVGKKSLRVGEFVKPGDALLAIVPQDKLYIIANYQETQLENIAHGQSVDIHIDTFSRPNAERAGGQHRAGFRRQLRGRGAGERHRQLHQDRSAHPGEDRV